MHLFLGLMQSCILYSVQRYKIWEVHFKFAHHSPVGIKKNNNNAGIDIPRRLSWGLRPSVRHRNLKQSPLSPNHGLTNYIETNAKCRHLKKLSCKGILRQVFIRVYSQSCWYFRPSFVNCCPTNLSGSSLTPPLFPVWKSIQYTCIQCLKGIWGHRRGEGLRKINTCRKVSLQVNF
jgi:hypothetical protein